MSDRLAEMKRIARRDDWHQKLVGSDIRWLIAEIEGLAEVGADAKIRLDDRKQRIERLTAENRYLRGDAHMDGCREMMVTLKAEGMKEAAEIVDTYHDAWCLQCGCGKALSEAICAKAKDQANA